MRRGILLLLVLLAILVPGTLAACGGGDEETAGGGGGGGAAQGDAQAGERVFADAGCENCHTLEAAGSTGTTGPNLDEAQPSFDEALDLVTNGGGGMPAFKGDLTEEQFRYVAAFVA